MSAYAFAGVSKVDASARRHENHQDARSGGEILVPPCTLADIRNVLPDSGPSTCRTAELRRGGRVFGRRCADTATNPP